MAKFILTKKTKRLIVSFKNQYSIIPLFRPQGNYGSIEEILYFQLVVEIPIHPIMR